VKVLVVVGTRPEAIKMAPVVRALINRPSHFETRLCLTGQHRDLLDPVIRLFELPVDVDLNVMRPGQSLFETTSAVLRGMEEVLSSWAPDMVLVHGDTTTAFAASLASFYQQIPVGHVEAGLRTADVRRPFPEEMNRRLSDQLCTWFYAPTPRACENLVREGVNPDHVIVTGNTVIDALMDVSGRPFVFEDPALDALGRERKLLLLTAHRRESFGAPFASICAAVKAIVEHDPEVELLYPVHPNPNIKKAAETLLGGRERIHLIPALSYEPFVHLMKKSTLILTDSGGIQEEAPSLGKPVLVLRDESERPEAVEAGTAHLVGTDPARITAAANALLGDPAARAHIAAIPNPYGNGHASARIAEHLEGLAAGAAGRHSGGEPA
jgi:UDP-N-acetylglucosamine 2-epimerase